MSESRVVMAATNDNIDQRPESVSGISDGLVKCIMGLTSSMRCSTRLVKGGNVFPV